MSDPNERASWPRGPWDDEPDEDAWEHKGVQCRAKRGGLGGWCGYIAIPVGHPWHGKGISGELEGIEVHGGLTYADSSLRGEENDAAWQIWWIGFDCIHAEDMTPGMFTLEESMRLMRFEHRSRDTYRTLEYVKSEVNSLADQALLAKEQRK